MLVHIIDDNSSVRRALKRLLASVGIEAWVVRRKETAPILVTQGKFTYVAIDDEGAPRAIATPASAP